MIGLKRLAVESSDVELRTLRIMVETSESCLKMGIISPEEHQETLRHVSSRLTDLEHKYGLDIFTQID